MLKRKRCLGNTNTNKNKNHQVSDMKDCHRKDKTNTSTKEQRTEVKTICRSNETQVEISPKYPTITEMLLK